MCGWGAAVGVRKAIGVWYVIACHLVGRQSGIRKMVDSENNANGAEESGGCGLDKRGAQAALRREAHVPGVGGVVECCGMVVGGVVGGAVGGAVVEWRVGETAGRQWQGGEGQTAAKRAIHQIHQRSGGVTEFEFERAAVYSRPLRTLFWARAIPGVCTLYRARAFYSGHACTHSTTRVRLSDTRT